MLRSRRASWDDGRRDNRTDREYRAARSEIINLVARLNNEAAEPHLVIQTKARIAEVERVISDYEHRADVVVDTRRNAILEAELRAREARLRDAELAYWRAAAEYRECREELAGA